MAKGKLLVDTDVFIDYFNVGLFSLVLESHQFDIYYSAVTKKELLSKKGLRDSEKLSIRRTLRRYRLVNIDDRIARRYSELRRLYPALEKEDCLIAATALVKRLPLLTRNWKHYRMVEELILFEG